MVDGAFLSHIVLWVIGAMSVCATVGALGALFTLGRSSYRKD